MKKYIFILIAIGIGLMFLLAYVGGFWNKTPTTPNENDYWIELTPLEEECQEGVPCSPVSSEDN